MIKILLKSSKNTKCFKSLGVLSGKLNLEEINLIRPDKIITDISHLEYKK